MGYDIYFKYSDRQALPLSNSVDPDRTQTGYCIYLSISLRSLVLTLRQSLYKAMGLQKRYLKRYLMENNKPDCGSVCTTILGYQTAVEILDGKYQS